MSKKTIPSLVLKNYQIQYLASWLSGPMSGADSRARNRFLKLLAPRMQEMDNERVKLLEQHADKDEEGKPIKENEGRNYRLAPEALETFNKEYTDLSNEEFTLDLLPSVEADFSLMRTALLNLDRKFMVDEGQVYDLVCTAFEEVQL